MALAFVTFLFRLGSGDLFSVHGKLNEMPSKIMLKENIFEIVRIQNVSNYVIHNESMVVYRIIIMIMLSNVQPSSYVGLQKIWDFENLHTLHQRMFLKGFSFKDEIL